MRKYRIIKFVTYFVFAVLVFILRHQLVQELHYLVGSLLLVYGLEELLYNLIFEKKESLGNISFYFGCMEIVLGIVTLFFVRSYEHNCILWASWSILKEAFEIPIAINSKQLLVKLTYFVQSGFAIVFSLFMLVSPNYKHAMVHAFLLIIELILKSIVPLINEYKKDNVSIEIKNNNC